MTNAASLAAVAASGFRRNRVQNGAMMIDQRFGGASPPITGSPFADRWIGIKGAAQTASAVVLQGVAGMGLPYSLVFNVTAGGASAAGEFVGIYQQIEGSDMGDLQWGTAAAKPVTLSFTIKTPVVGLYAFRLINTASTRCYVGTVMVNAADVPQRVFHTIPGDTTGGWPITANDKWQLFFDMGSGANLIAPNVGWHAVNYTRIAGSVSFAAATRFLSITGVQLEVGSIATPFEWRNIREQLADCLRWYERGRAVLYVGVAGVGQLNAPIYWNTKRTLPLMSGATAGHSLAAYTVNAGTATVSAAVLDTTWIADCEGT